MRAWPARDSRALFGSGEADGSLVVLVLNHELPACTPRLWRAAALRVAADGGANRLYDELPALLPQLSAEQARLRVAEVLAASRAVASRAPPPGAQVREQFVPHVVLGDLDSARPEVLAFYAARGARVVDVSAEQARPHTSAAACFALLRTPTDGPRAGHERPAQVRGLRTGCARHGRRRWAERSLGRASRRRAGRAGRPPGPRAGGAVGAARLPRRAHHAAGLPRGGHAAAARRAPAAPLPAAGGARLRPGAPRCVAASSLPPACALTRR